MSHLLQMRGLKLKEEYEFEIARLVASFTDAWIETEKQLSRITRKSSHLLQMRGLKPVLLASV